MNTTRAVEYARQVAVAVLDLATPQFCAGCAVEGAAICDGCATHLYVPLIRVPARATYLPIWAAAHYTATTRLVVQAWKRGRIDVGQALPEVLRTAADRWQVITGQQVDAVVPAPSGWRRRLAGHLVARDAAMVVAAQLGANMCDPLRRRIRLRAPAKLAGASARRRARVRTASALRVSGLPPVRGDGKPARVLLVDDVVTTGATLGAAAAALEEVWNVTVVGALVLAAAPMSSSAHGAIR